MAQARHPPVEEYDVMYRVEDIHWWYRGMEAITRRVIERQYARGGRLHILDAGAGTGAAMRYLADYGTVFGIDYATEAIHYCQLRQQDRLALGSVMALPYPAGTFDLVTSFDVVCQYGVTDDTCALREFARVLAPGGRLVLRVPGARWLRGQHDTAADVEKRYNVRGLKAKLSEAGLCSEHITYANMFLFPIAATKRLSERWLPHQNGSDLTLGMGPFNGLLSAVLASEAPLVAGPGLPYGLTIVALARKPTL